MRALLVLAVFAACAAGAGVIEKQDVVYGQGYVASSPDAKDGHAADLKLDVSLPEGPGPFPAVVLVHDSGPQDQDGTVGAVIRRAMFEPLRPLTLEADGADWPNRAASRKLRAGGVDWHVQILGDGPVLFLTGQRERLHQAVAVGSMNDRPVVETEIADGRAGKA